MKCLNCGKEFKGRADAKFDSAKCRVAYSRVTDNNSVTDNPKVVTDNVTDNVTDKLPEDKSFTPNWKRSGYASKREGLLAAMAALGNTPSLEGQVFHVGDTSWEVKKGKMERIA